MGREREAGGRDGWVLFLACPAICPGVKVCTHRGCPWARGGQALTGNQPRPMSQFLLVGGGGGNHTFVGLPPAPPPPCPPHPPGHTASSVTVRYACSGLPGSSWPCENGRGCLPSLQSLLKFCRLKEHSSPHLDPMLIT